MSLIDEYARNKVDMEQRRIMGNLLRAGNSPQKISDEAEVPLSTVEDIEKSLKSKK